MSFGRLGSLGRGLGRLGAGGVSAPLLLRSVATRANVPWGFNIGLTDAMSRSAHFARDAVTSIRVAFPNWYVDTNNNTNTWAELGTGSTASIKVGFETAGGATSQFLFSGVATGSITSGSVLVSDVLSVSLAPGDKFYLRTKFSNASGVLYMPQAADSTLGDRLEFTATDKSLSGTIADGNPGYAYLPAAILGMTRRRSGWIIGTSRSHGQGDTADGTTGNMGMVARGLGPLAAYGNGGVPGDTIQRVAAAPTKRASIANTYYTDTFIEHGINDYSARSLVQMQGDFTTVMALITNRIHLVSNAPNTSGAWTLADGSDQTNLAGTKITDLNTWLATLPNSANAFHDVAPLVSLAGNVKWKAPGYTADGLHGTQTAYIAAGAAIGI